MVADNDIVARIQEAFLHWDVEGVRLELESLRGQSRLQLEEKLRVVEAVDAISKGIEADEVQDRDVHRLAISLRVNWLRNPRDDFEKDLRGKVVERLQGILEQFYLRGQFLWLNQLISDEKISTLLPTEVVEAYRKQYDNYTTSLNLAQEWGLFNLFERLQKAREQLSRLESLPENERVQALKREAQQVLQETLRERAQKVATLSEEMERARSKQDWGQMRVCANKILALDPDNSSAKAGKKEAESRQRQVRRATKARDEVQERLRKVPFDDPQKIESEYEQVLDQINKALRRVPESMSAEVFLDLRGWKQSLEALLPLLRQSCEWARQQNWDGALDLLQPWLNQENEGNPVYQSVRSIVLRWKEHADELRKQRRAERRRINALRRKVEKAASREDLWLVRDECLQEQAKDILPEHQERLKALLESIDTRLDESLIQEFRMQIKTATTYQELEAIRKELDAVPFGISGEANTPQGFLREGSREAWRSLLDLVDRRLDEFAAEQKDLDFEIQRAIEKGAYVKARRLLRQMQHINRQAGKEAAARIRQEEKQLADIKALLSVDPERAVEQLQEFLDAHPINQRARRLQREAEERSNQRMLARIEKEWEESVASRSGLDTLGEILSKALGLAQGDDLTRWKERQDLLEQLKRKHRKVNSLVRTGDLHKAKALLQDINEYENVEAEIQAIDAAIAWKQQIQAAFEREDFATVLRLLNESANEWQAALKSMEEMKKIEAEARFRHFQILAQRALDDLNYSAAERHLQEALKFAPADAREVTAQLQAVRMKKEVVEQWEQQAEKLWEEGERCEREGRLDEARERYNDILLSSEGREEWINRWKSAFMNEVYDAINRVEQLIEVREKLQLVEDIEERLSLYETWARYSRYDADRYQQEQEFVRELKEIENEMEFAEQEGLRRLSDRLSKLRGDLKNLEHWSLCQGLFARVQRKMAARQNLVGQFEQKMKSAQQARAEERFETAIALLKDAADMVDEKDPARVKVISLQRMVEGDIRRRREIEDNLKQVQVLIENESWEEANKLLVDIETRSPFPSQEALFKEYKQRVQEALARKRGIQQQEKMIRKALAVFDYQQAYVRLRQAQEEYGEDTTFVDLEAEINRVRTTCLQVKDLVERVNLAYQRKKYAEAQRLLEQMKEIESVEEILRYKGWKILEVPESGEGWLQRLRKRWFGKRDDRAPSEKGSVDYPVSESLTQDVPDSQEN